MKNRNKTKICFFSDSGSIHTINLVSKFIEFGYEVHVITFSEEKIKGAQMHNAGPLIKFPFFKFLLSCFIKRSQIRNIVKRVRPSIVYGDFIIGYAFLSALVGIKPLIVSAWGSDIASSPEKSILLKKVCKYTFSKADYVRVHDVESKERAVELGCDPSKIFVTPLGMYLAEKDIPKKCDGERKKMYGVFKNIVICSRKLEIAKYHVDIFVKSIPFVLREHPSTLFVLAGNGKDINKLKEYAEKNNLGDNLLFLEGISNKEMIKYLVNSDIYVDPYFPNSMKSGGGVGISTMEAMFCEVALVLARRPSVTENQFWFSGEIYESSNYKSLAEKICYLLSNRDIRKKKVNNGKLKAKKYFQWGKNSSIIEDFIWEKINSK